MIILFLHRSFPAQFKNLATELAKNPMNEVLFITNSAKNEIPGVTKLLYDVQQQEPTCTPVIKGYENNVLHGQAAANVMMSLKYKNITPDIIIGFSWGPPMFVKEIFPDVPFLCYFEWFNKTQDSVFDFGNKKLNEDRRVKIAANNTHILVDLYNCDAGITPTQWQKSQFPKEYQDKIKLIHDGVDTEICKADKSAKLLIKDKNIELTAEDEVITYGTRGMEPYRGFPEFMEAVAVLCKKRPNAHFVIAGTDAVCYGPKDPNIPSYKELMLKKLDLDMKRVHFVGSLEYEEYIKFLQVSSAHIYLTYPFILSWSILEAMAAECCIIASNTKPVLEVIENNKNGLIVDFPNVADLVEKIEYALDNKKEMEAIRANARQTIIEDFALKEMLPKQIEYIKSIVRK